MRNPLPVVGRLIHGFGERTTIHGMTHAFRVSGRVRKLFWFVLFVASLSAGIYHTAETLSRFTGESVLSQLLIGREEAVFPDITICNLKAASASLSRSGYYGYYLRDEWNYFSDWFNKTNLSIGGNSDFKFYSKIVRDFARRLLQVMWVSADTRDISHLDKISLLECSFNNEPCDHRNFSLVQNNRYWNCYTFHVQSHRRGAGVGGKGDELQLVLFTDNYNKAHHLNPSRLAAKSLVNVTKEFWLKFPFTVGISQTLRDGSYEPTGLRLFIHEPQTYPLYGTEVIDIGSGTSTKITLKPIINRLISGSNRQCSEAPHEKVHYVTHFSNGSKDVVTREYAKSIADFVSEAKQTVVFKNCGCYSHKLPFTVNTSQLCYFAPPEQWRSPSDTMIDNIRCHDRWIEQANGQHAGLKKQFENRRWCEYTRYRPWSQSTRWPSFGQVAEIFEELIVPLVENDNEFLPKSDHKHHIFRNYNEPMPRAMLSFLSALIVYPTNKCLWHFCMIVGEIFHCNDSSVLPFRTASRCIEQDALAKNIATVRIGLESVMADVYKEEASYDWTEALSEVGGTLGLWIGVSFVSCFELVDLLYLLIWNLAKPFAVASR